jgi:hypothetical protein
MDTKTPLSAAEIVQKIGCAFLPYSRMHQITHIDELLPCSLILYELERVGHFCCVFENSQGINFFDPMGFKIDSELNLTNPNRIKALKHDYTYLINLLLNQDKPVIYNEYKLQKPGTSTCGHWCTIRMIYSNLQCDEFAKCFKPIKSKDSTIVKLYSSI